MLVKIQHTFRPMTQITLTSPVLAQARTNLEALITSFQDHTKLASSVIIKAVGGDPKFLATYKDRDFQIGTYDRMTSRFAALWPSDASWPEGVHRPEPAQIESDTREMVKSALERARRRETRKEKSDG